MNFFASNDESQRDVRRFPAKLNSLQCLALRCKMLLWLWVKHHHRRSMLEIMLLTSLGRSEVLNWCHGAENDPSLLDIPEAPARIQRRGSFSCFETLKIQFLHLTTTDNLNFLVCRLNFCNKIFVWAYRLEKHLREPTMVERKKNRERFRAKELSFILGRI